jgi:O-antigen/teichoic acid export membrane protein
MDESRSREGQGPRQGVPAHETRRPPVRRLVQRVGRVSGAAVAPFTQALSSLLLQVVSLRSLGAEGFGVYALLYSGLLVITALSSGLVGDSLTVLDRSRPEVRAGLVVVGWVSTPLGGAVALLAAWGSGLVPLSLAVLFGVAVMAFVCENLLRRLLMAALSFGRIIAVDLAVLLGTLASLAALHAASHGALTLGHLLTSLLVAQVVGMVAGVALLPTSERRLAPGSTPDVWTVLRFGSWRAAQQGIRPASLTSVRIVIVAAVGAALFGELEAARVYTSPAMLLVNGAAGFFLASYSTQSGRPLRRLLRRADAGAPALALAILVLGSAALFLLPRVGDLITGGAFDLDRVAVVGWIVYAGVNAVALPYASLASVRGRHVLMVILRLVEAVVSLAVVTAGLVVLDMGVAWVPLGLSVGPLATALIVRSKVLPSTSESGKDAAWQQS